MRALLVLLAACAAGLPPAASAQQAAGDRPRWTLEAYGGNAVDLWSRLRVEQDGGYAKSQRADFDTRGFTSPYWYMLRVSQWRGNYGWELSFIHHKLYLRNRPEGVSDLSISHGFNILTANSAYRAGDWTYRFGIGPVIAHPEATINGVHYDGPYQLTGGAALAGVGRRFYFGRSAFVSIEGMLTVAYANPKMRGDPSAEMRVLNTALHGAIGLGYDF